MSYYIPRIRNLRINKGKVDDIHWPCRTVISVRLSPKEVFAKVTETETRAVVVGKSAFHFNANNGKFVAKSEEFLSDISFISRLGNIEVQIEGDILTLVAEVGSYQEFCDGLIFAEQYLPAFFSTAFGVFVQADEITGSVGATFEFRYEIKSARILFQQSNEDFRRELVEKALGLSGIHNERFLLACTYYQQALRLASPHEANIPAANLSEIALNLAKSIEIMFNVQNEQQLNDTIRSQCKLLGYSSQQIESQIIPLMIMRNKFDIAHPAGSILSSDDVTVLHNYIYRSISNVQNILLRVGRLIASDSVLIPDLPPLSEKGVRDKRKFVDGVRKYYEDQGLPDERANTSNIGSVIIDLDRPGDQVVSSRRVEDNKAEEYCSYRKMRSNFSPGVTVSLARPFCSSAIAHVNNGQFQSAINEFNQGLKVSPNYAPAIFGIAVCYYKVEKAAEAVAEVDRAIVLDPDLADAHMLRGLAIILHMGKRPNAAGLSEAIHSLEKAREVKPRNAVLLIELIKAINALWVRRLLGLRFSEARRLKARAKALGQQLTLLQWSRDTRGHFGYEVDDLSISV